MQELPDPNPRLRPAIYQPFVWPTGTRWQLEPRREVLELELCALLEQRETRRNFKSRLESLTLGEFLWLACRNRSSRSSPFGPDQESRVYPSAGAMHPIHVLLARETGPWMLYDPTEHALIELPNSSDSAAAGRDVSNHLVALDQGVLFGLVSEPGREQRPSTRIQKRWCGATQA